MTLLKNTKQLTEKSLIRRRQRSEVDGADAKPRASNFAYFVIKNEFCISVCKQAFMSLHAISHIQVQRLTSIILSGKSSKDKRGKHNNRPSKIKDEFIVKMKEHIESFPVKTSHYSSKTSQYLSCGLNTKAMHRLFIKKHPDLENKINYECYLKFFQDNYNFSFGRPQVDVCSECEHLGSRIRDKNLNDNAKRVATAQLLIHKNPANKFYNKLKEVENLCKENPDVAAISFDFMQNLPLPNIPVQ